MISCTRHQAKLHQIVKISVYFNGLNILEAGASNLGLEPVLDFTSLS